MLLRGFVVWRNWSTRNEGEIFHRDIEDDKVAPLNPDVSQNMRRDDYRGRCSDLDDFTDRMTQLVSFDPAGLEEKRSTGKPRAISRSIARLPEKMIRLFLVAGG